MHLVKCCSPFFRGSPKLSEAMDNHQHCYVAAQKGETLIREGNTSLGLQYLEEAVNYGTSDVYLLSAIYSQIGNAYFALKDFPKAEYFYSQDLMLCKTINDYAGEAKAHSNRAFALSAMRDFHKALNSVECLMALAVELNIKSLLSCAYYTKGYVYLQKARENMPHENEELSLFPQPIKSSSLSDSAREDLYTAIDAFTINAKLAEENNEQISCALAYANLGHCHFMLEQYDAAVRYHGKKLGISRAVNDKPAMRRAYTNIGNSHFYNGDFESAISNWELAANASYEIGDKPLQAQALCSIGIAATIAGNLDQAISAHSKHLQLSRELKDPYSQSKSLIALGTIFSFKKDTPKAVYFFIVNYKIVFDLPEQDMECKGRNSIRIAIQSDPSSILKEDRIVLDPTYDIECPLLTDDSDDEDKLPIDPTSITFALREDGKATSVPNLADAMTKFVTDCANGLRPSRILPMKRLGDNLKISAPLTQSMPNVKSFEHEDISTIMDRLNSAQSRRFEDQRCNPPLFNEANKSARQTDTFRLSASDINDSKKSKSFIHKTKKMFSLKSTKAPGSRRAHPLTESTPIANRGKASSLNISPLSSRTPSCCNDAGSLDN